jgi:hypothetical protein
MKATVKIEKIGENGSTIRIIAECDSVTEVQEITQSLREFTPRAKIFGVF